jgi:ELWxxDGT repeat protein
MRLGPADTTPTKLAAVAPATGERPVRLGNWLYFIASQQVWRTDGTPAGTTLVVNTTNAADLTLAGHLLYYTNAGFNPGTGNKLYATDGTPAGTYAVPGGPLSGLQRFTAVGDTLYFTAGEGVHGRELWRADEVPPAAVASAFNYAANPHTLTVTFTENVGASLTLSDWTLIDRATGQDVSSLLTSLAFNPDTNTATLTPDLPKGDYRLTLPAGAAADPAGNPTAAETSLDFFHLPGDVNRDRAVNFTDLLTLARNYNQAAVGYANGDLNGDGVVNFNDLLILARNYTTPLPVPPAAPVTASFTTATVTPARAKTPAVFSSQPPIPKPPPAPPRKPAPPRRAR